MLKSHYRAMAIAYIDEERLVIGDGEREIYLDDSLSVEKIKYAKNTAKPGENFALLRLYPIEEKGGYRVATAVFLDLDALELQCAIIKAQEGEEVIDG